MALRRLGRPGSVPAGDPAVTAYAAFLRAVNVGGRNRCSMKDLSALVVELGHADVATYVQSGNVVFTASAPAADVAGGLERGFQQAFGFKAGVVLRSRKDLEGVVRRNPFPPDDPTKVHVLFLAAKPDRKAVGTLDPEASPGDGFVVDGREVFLSYPNGSGRSKLNAAYFERKLGVQGTARNWRTVTKVLDLMET